MPYDARLVRRFEPADAPRVAQVWFESAQGADPSDRTSLEDYERRLMSDTAGWTIHVAPDGAGIGGFLAFQAADNWLRQLFVAPKLQGRGVGHALLDVAKREMPQGFWLRTDADNANARRFYERAGLMLREMGVHPIHGQAIATYDWRARDQ